MTPYDPQQNPPPEGMQVQTGQSQGQQRAEGPSLFDQWNDWIDKPGNRAAMMQFGIAMLQPMQPGENALSHAANAIGYGGEAEARVEQQRRQEELAQSQERLRESQGQLAESRAATAGSMADVRARNADIALERLQTQRELAGMRDLITAQHNYGVQKSKYDEQRIANPSLPEYDDFQTWLSKQGINPMSVTQPQRETSLPPRGQDETTAQLRTTAQLFSDPSLSANLNRLRDKSEAEKRATLDKIAPHVSDPARLYREFGLDYRGK